MLLALENATAEGPNPFAAASQIALALLVGLLGVIAALAGNRYLHVLQLRAEHRRDFLSEVIRPWKAHLRSYAGWKLHSGLRRWVNTAYEKDFPFRAKVPALFGDADRNFYPRGALWERSKQHWPALHREWDALQVDVAAFEEQIVDVALRIEQRIEQGNHPLKWNYHDPKIPKMGIRIFVTALLPWLAEEYHEPLSTRLTFRVERKNDRDEEWAFIMHQGTEALGTKENAEGSKTTLEAIRDDLKTRGDFDKLRSDWEALQRKAEALAVRVENVEYNYGLGGRCASCPRFFTRQS